MSNQLATPKKFKPAIEVVRARLLPGKPDFIKRKRSRGRYAVGIRYERKVHEHLAQLSLGLPNLEYLQGPWVEFWDQRGHRYCQPDALLVDRVQKAIVIYEVKYQHTADAWWQLVHLYRPVISVIYPEYRPIALMEIVHWHDPSVVFPERYDFTRSPLKVPHANTVAVHIFNPKRNGRVVADGHHEREGAGQAAGAEWYEKGTLGALSST